MDNLRIKVNGRPGSLSALSEAVDSGASGFRLTFELPRLVETKLGKDGGMFGATLQFREGTKVVASMQIRPAPQPKPVPGARLSLQGVAFADTRLSSPQDQMRPSPGAQLITFTIDPSPNGLLIPNPGVSWPLVPPQLESIMLKLVVNQSPLQLYVDSVEARWIAPSALNSALLRLGVWSWITSAPERFAEQIALSIADQISATQAQRIAARVNGLVDTGLAAGRADPADVGDLFMEVLETLGFASSVDTAAAAANTAYWLNGFRELAFAVTVKAPISVESSWQGRPVVVAAKMTPPGADGSRTWSSRGDQNLLIQVRLRYDPKLQKLTITLEDTDRQGPQRAGVLAQGSGPHAGWLKRLVFDYQLNAHPCGGKASPHRARLVDFDFIPAAGPAKKLYTLHLAGEVASLGLGVLAQLLGGRSQVPDKAFDSFNESTLVQEKKAEMITKINAALEATSANVSGFFAQVAAVAPPGLKSHLYALLAAMAPLDLNCSPLEETYVANR